MFCTGICGRSITAFAAVAVGLAGSPSANAHSSDATPFILGAHREPLVDVRVNGDGPFVFVLDTGSSHSAISNGLARTIGARAVAKAVFASSLGQEMLPVVRLARLELGPSSTSDVLATVVDDDALDGSGRIQGVIGQDILSARRYTLDFDHQRVVWHSQSHVRTPHGLTLALRSSRDRFLVDLPQDGSTLSLVPDSGAEGLVLYTRPDRHLPRLTIMSGHARMATLTDREFVRQVNVHELRVGSATLRDVPAVLVDHGDPSAGDGLLPLALFGRVTFDGPDGVITLEPRSRSADAR